jgi:uncharacterized membrane protein YdbT with pleckstrin-like domain
MSHLAEDIHQKSYEHIEMVLRRHWLTFFPVIGLFLLLAAVPVGVYFLLPWSGALLADPVGYPLVVLAGSIYYLFLWVFFFAQFIDYYFDTWIVTNDRLVDIEQRGLFSRVVTELDLYLIQDVTSETHGFFANVFNYGDVLIDSAGPKQRVEFKNVPHPNEVRNQVVQLAEGDRKYHHS